MPRKGHKSVKDVGDLYGEKKRVRGLTLTDTAMQGLEVRATELGISKSEVVEQFARGLIGLPSDLTKEEKQKLGEACGSYSLLREMSLPVEESSREVKLKVIAVSN